ncbi:S-layer homology domain-containing protein [Cytobacillus massiliigabonensis]|uniref:S-layer homology domain-containing protein n=1 Tax=Cytobacillus massiliigabonensis TaxID=1871011 RepID=UPI000C834350|nr:S-layer homology domain-containing protein [Cytobacillus massiliigabonensis]
MSSKSKLNKFIAGSVTAAVVASAIVPAVSAAESKSFSDVEGNWAADAINALAQAGVVNGYEDGTFRPSLILNRGQAANLLTNALDLEIPSDLKAFDDVSSASVFAEGAAATKAAGIFGGSNGKFGAADQLTREQMASVLVRAFDLKNTGEEVEIADLDKISASHRENVIILAQNKVTVTNDGMFNPKGNVSRAHFATFLYRAMNVDTVVKEIASIGSLKDITVKEGEKVELPKTVEVTYKDDSKKEVAVTWKETDFSKPGVYNVEGTVEGTELKAAVKVTVEAVAPAVESVSAINAGTIVVTFNKAIKESTVVEQSGAGQGTLVDGVFTLTTAAGGTVAVNGMNAELDGKTLTIYTGSALSGAYNFNVTKDKVTDTTGKFVAASTTTINVKDETRASITGVKQVSKYVFDITLSEPVASTGAVSAAYTDGTTFAGSVAGATLRDNNKTIRVTLTGTIVAGKEINLSVPALTDLAGNVSVPLTQKVTVSDADKTPATVVSAASTSAETIEVTFSEAVTVTAANFTYNGAAVTSVLPVSGDTTQTKYVVTLPAEQTTAGYLALAAGATTDLSGNTSVASSHLINFAVDKVAPTIESSKVVTDASGDNYLVLQLSEKVRLNTTTPGNVTNLTMSYEDKFGVAQTKTVPAANVSVDTTDASIVKVKLFDNAGTPVAIPTDETYTVKFGTGYFEDLYKNESVAKTITFTNTGSKETSTKLALTGSPLSNGVDLKKGAYVQVDFASAVDPTSAKTLSNYTVEGSNVTNVELVSNSTSGASVKVYLTNDTITTAGTYNVTVKGVKGYSSSVTEMDAVTNPLVIQENVGAKVASKAITFTAGTSTSVAVTFNEAVKETSVTASDDYALYIDGVKVVETPAITVTGDQGTTATTTVTFQINKDLSTAIAAGKSVKLVATDDLNLVDAQGNRINTADITLN